MAGSAMAGNITVAIPDNIKINPQSDAYTSVNVSVKSIYPGSYKFVVAPQSGLEAYIGNLGDSSALNIGSATNPIIPPYSYRLITINHANEELVGKLYVRATDGSWSGFKEVKLSVYDGNTEISDSITVQPYSSGSLSVETPEFPTVALPVAGILGLLFIFGRKKEGL